MDYKKLIKRLEEWNENLISEMCANDVLTCDDLCGCVGDCIVVQAATAITELLARAEAAEAENAALRKMQPVQLDDAGAQAMELAAEVSELKRKLEAAEARAEKAEEIASDLCDDFTDFVTGGIHNAAPYCANCRPECVNAHGWCNGDNKVCRGFMPKAAVWKEE